MITNHGEDVDQESVDELVRIWAEVLGVTQVGLDEDFYALGGDSLGALHVVARCREAGLPVTIADVMTSASVVGLARLISGRRQAAAAKAPVTLEPAGPAAGADQPSASGWLPLSGPQQWEVKLGVGDRNRLVQTQVLITRPGMEAELVGRAVRQVAASHPALRLRFLLSDGVVTAQQVLEGADVPYEHTDATDLASLQLETEAMRQRLSMMIDLAQGPVFVAGYVRGPDGQPGRLILCVHQIAIDAASWQLLRRHIDWVFAHLQAGHEGSAGHDGSAGLGADRYEEWVIGYQRYARSERTELQLPYWTGRIDPGQVAANQPVCLAEDAGSLTEWLSPEQSAMLLTELPRRTGVRSSDLLLGIFVRAAASWAGHEGLYVDLLRHGRGAAVGTDVSLTVGYFTTTVPTWLTVRPDASALEAARLVRSSLAAEPDDGVGYTAMRYCGGDRARSLLGAIPSPEVSFSYQSQIPVRWRGALTTGMALDEQDEEFPPDWERPNPIEMACAVVDGRLVAELSYCRERYSPGSMKSLLSGHFTAGLVAAASDGDAEGHDRR